MISSFTMIICTILLIIIAVCITSIITKYQEISDEKYLELSKFVEEYSDIKNYIFEHCRTKVLNYQFREIVRMVKQKKSAKITFYKILTKKHPGPKSL